MTLNLAAVIRIDGAGTVHQGQTMPECKPAARPNLRFKANRQGDRATSTAAVDREVRRFGVSALVGAVTAASFGVCEDN